MVGECVDDDQSSSGEAIWVWIAGDHWWQVRAGVGDDDGEGRGCERDDEGHLGSSVADGVRDQFAGQEQSIVEGCRGQLPGLPAQVRARCGGGVRRVGQCDGGMRMPVGRAGGAVWGAAQLSVSLRAVGV